MGANPSKPGEHGAAPSRKLRPRSSINLLKRTRTTSNPTRASYPVPAIATVDLDGVGDTNSANHLDELSSPSSSEQSPGSPVHNSLLSSTVEELEDDGGSVSSTGTANRLTTPTKHGKHVAPSTPPNEQTQESKPTTPDSLMTPRVPRIMLTLPTMLPEDSPTKYGLRTGHTPSPERTLTKAQRRDMTGPMLFAHSVAQLKSYHDPSSDPSSKRSSYSQSSPCLLSFSGRQHEHAKSLPNGATRPLTNRSDHNLLSTGAQYYHVVHALPMQPSQLDCFRRHDGWHPAAKPRYNVLNPVSCAVCDEYGAPSEAHEAAGDDFRRCNWCWLIVCGKCHDAFLNGGLSATMDRGQGAVEKPHLSPSPPQMVLPVM